MSDMTLTISIDSASVGRIITAGQSVTLAWVVTSVTTGLRVASDQLAQGAASQVIVWCAFSPFQNNTVAFDGRWFGFVSMSALSSLATIQIATTTAATLQPGLAYTYAAGGFAVSPQTSAQYVLGNGQSSSASVLLGLSSTAVVNGAATSQTPLCAATVLYNQLASFNPPACLLVFLSTATPGQVIPAPQNQLALAFQGLPGTVAVGFNASNNTFYQM